MTTESNVFTALRAFILAAAPDVNECVQGQQNAIAGPASDNYVVMWPTSRQRLATNNREYDPNTGIRGVSASTQVVVQIDVHGSKCADITQRITTLFRDVYATEFFKSLDLGVTPLYCDDGKQLPFSTGEKSWENRWVLYAELQITPTVSTTYQFADTLGPELVEVDTTYPE